MSSSFFVCSSWFSGSVPGQVRVASVVWRPVSFSGFCFGLLSCSGCRCFCCFGFCFVFWGSSVVSFCFWVGWGCLVWFCCFCSVVRSVGSFFGGLLFWASVSCGSSVWFLVGGFGSGVRSFVLVCCGFVGSVVGLVVVVRSVSSFVGGFRPPFFYCWFRTTERTRFRYSS